MSAKISTNFDVIIVWSAVEGRVPRTRVFQSLASSRVCFGIAPRSPKWIRGRTGRPSSKKKNTRRLRMENPTLVVAGKQPVHFMSFKTFVTSKGCKVYPIIPLFKKKGTAALCKSVRISEQGMTHPRCMRN